jgi:hypothetical protein
MLAAADAAACTGSLTQQLGHEPLYVSGEGYVVAMTAVIAEHKIALTQLSGKCERRKFLSDTGMNRSVQLPLREQFQKLLLHRTDSQCLFDMTVMYGNQFQVQTDFILTL